VAHPHNDDVVVRQEHGNPSTVYLLGTPSAPDHFVVRTRDDAVAQALRFAKYQHMAAWFVEDGTDAILLGTFRKERSAFRNEGDTEPTMPSCRKTPLERE
jgi:hypothetical protein